MVGFRSVASTHVKSTNNVLRVMMVMVMMDWGSRRGSFGCQEVGREKRRVGLKLKRTGRWRYRYKALL